MQMGFRFLLLTLALLAASVVAGPAVLPLELLLLPVPAALAPCGELRLFAVMLLFVLMVSIPADGSAGSAMVVIPEAPNPPPRSRSRSPPPIAPEDEM